MNIISPSLDLETEATHEIIAESISRLKGREDPFIILESSELTFMQCLWTENGYVLEYQEENVSNHYRASKLLSENEIVSAMQSYISFNSQWKSDYQFDRVNVMGVFWKLGYKTGQFFGALRKGLERII